MRPPCGPLSPSAAYGRARLSKFNLLPEAGSARTGSRHHPDVPGNLNQRQSDPAARRGPSLRAQTTRVRESAVPRRAPPLSAGSLLRSLRPQTAISIYRGSKVERPPIWRPTGKVVSSRIHYRDPTAFGNRLRPIQWRHRDAPAIGLNPDRKSHPAIVGRESPVEIKLYVECFTIGGRDSRALAIGLPGAVDRYQVNFRVPADTMKSLAAIQLSAAWVVAASVSIMIQ